MIHLSDEDICNRYLKLLNVATFSLHEMVFLNKNKKNFTGRRVGQTQLNSNGMMNMNGMQNASNAFSTSLNPNIQFETFNGTLGQFANGAPTSSGNGMVTLESANVSAQNGYFSENITLDTIEGQAELDIDVGVQPNGTRLVSISDDQSGAQVVASIPPAQVVEQVDEECEFPVQRVRLRRDVNITDTPSKVIDVRVDRCGNANGYSEEKDRIMSAGEWYPVIPSQLDGPVRPLIVNGQGTIRNASNNVRLANSPGLNGFTAQTQVEQGPLVGGRKSSTAYAQSLLNRRYRSG